MKNECSIVRDLLPLYAEKMVGDDTAEFVASHLSKCPECNEIFSSMQEPGKELADEEREEERRRILPLRIVKQKLLCKKIVTSVIAVVLSLAILLGVGTYVYNFVDKQNKIVHIDCGDSQWYSMKDRTEAADFVKNVLYSMGFGYDIISIKFAGDAECLQAYLDRKGDQNVSTEDDTDYRKYLVFYVEIETPAWANPFWGLKPSTYYDNLKWVVSKEAVSGSWQGTYVTPDPTPDPTPDK